MTDRLNHRYSQSAQWLRKACSEFKGISVSLSDWVDSYALWDSTHTYLTSHASVICTTEKSALHFNSQKVKAMFNYFVYCRLCRLVLEKNHERVLVAKRWELFDTIPEIESANLPLRWIANS